MNLSKTPVKSGIMAVFFGCTSACWAGGITSTKYFPPDAPGGNVINISYSYNESHGPNQYTHFSTAFNFDNIDPSPTGTKFVATQFAIGPMDGSGKTDGMYMGVNPPDGQSNYPGQVHFSYFGTSGGKLYDPNCTGGADNGDGVTCAINVAAHPGDYFLIEAFAEHPDDTRTLVTGLLHVYNANTQKGQNYQIGRFDVTGKQMGFSYPFTWVEGTSDPCSALKYTKIDFGPISIYANNSTYTIPLDTVASTKCGVTAAPASGGATSMWYGN